VLSQIIDALVKDGLRIVMCGLAVSIAFADLRTRRIPNILVLLLLTCALIWHAIVPRGAGISTSFLFGGIGFVNAFLGALYAFFGFLFLHLFKVMGAGDVKLAAALGAVFGQHELVTLALTIFLSGGVLVIARMIDSQRRTQLLGNLKLIGLGILSGAPGGSRAFFDPRSDSADRLPFGVAMVAGGFVFAALIHFGFIDPNV
jgi:prepilin peptidase CpaA